MINLVKDPLFLKGFNILKRSLLEDNHNNLICLPYQNNNATYRLAEYFSKQDFYNKREILVRDNEYIIKNDYKEIYKDKENRLTLSIKCEKEYNHLREFNEAWPHLLIEQEFNDELIKNMKSLIVDLDLDFLSLESFINKERNDLHTLQVSLYFAIGDNNINSIGYKDYYWFGLPLIDAPRYRYPKEYCSQDIGKEDATNKLIYSINPKIYMKDMFLVGDNLNFKLNIIEYVKEGFLKAKELGYLKNTSFEDLSLFSFNFGFEVTGTFNGKIRINKLNIFKEENQ